MMVKTVFDGDGFPETNMLCRKNNHKSLFATGAPLSTTPTWTPAEFVSNWEFKTGNDVTPTHAES